MKKALIIGFGLSGRSAANALLSQGVKITAVDDKYEEILLTNDVQEMIKKGVNLIPGHTIFDLSQFDYAVCSPGIPPSHPIIELLTQAKIHLVSEAQFAFTYLNQPIIGISGTNGKTTVTLLVAHILNYAHKKARALGNVGIPLTSAINHLEPNEIVVAELSSYQLEGLQGPLLDTSVLLNITPDHLDRYQTMENYARAKFKLIHLTKQSSHCFIESKTQHEFKSLLPYSSISSYGYDVKDKLSTDLNGVFIDGNYVIDLPESLKNKKNHDVENFLAAFALCSTLNVPPQLIQIAYNTFTKPSHRIEFIREVNKIRFFDDSKGTNIDAVIRAVQIMEGFTHLIVGGVDKGASYTPWIPIFKGKVKKLYAIGQAAKKILQDLREEFEVQLCQSLDEAVNASYSNALAGENVLLSPGCSSFDMFKDYVDRGKAFQKIVNSLS